MSSIAPFTGYLPSRERAAGVSCPPYDVLTAQEARRIAEDSADNFVRVIRSEVDFPVDTDPYSPEVYEKAKANLDLMIGRGLLTPTARESYFLYRQRSDGREQTGIVAAVSLDEYLAGGILRHELTRPEKEQDREKHIATTCANTGQVFLIYRARNEIDALVSELCAGEPLLDFTADDGVANAIWAVDKPEDVARVTAAFEQVPHLFIADGHHRIAASAKVLQKRRWRGIAPAGSPYERVMATMIPHDQVTILPYNRLVNALEGRTSEDIFSQVTQAFDVTRTHEPDPPGPGVFGMYIKGNWYRIQPKSRPHGLPAEKRLDVAVLQDQILRPLIGVEDPRTDPRLEFIGGPDGVTKLARRCDEVGCVVAFACYPTSVEELMFISESGGLMPPKSTWLEPKLRSGLVVRRL